MMTPELQGGWFSNVGGKLSENQGGIDADQIRGLTLLCLENGVTVMNYYMLFGGTNFGTWNSRNITTTYDYNAPIRECGGVGEKYAAVKGLGLMLRECGPGLARSTRLQTRVDSLPADVHMGIRRGENGALYLFCRAGATARDGTATVHPDQGPALRVKYELRAGESKLLYLPPGKIDSSEGEWYPKPVALPRRPASVPPPVRIGTALWRDDPGGRTWMPIDEGESTFTQGIFEPQFLMYRTRVMLTSEQAKRLQSVNFDLFDRDRVRVAVNGKLAPTAKGFHGEPVTNVQGMLQPGENQIVTLLDDEGVSNWGESKVGIRRAALARFPVFQQTLEQWRVALLPAGIDSQAEVAAGFDDSAWDSFVLNQKTLREFKRATQPGAPPLTYPAMGILCGRNNTSAIFRTEVDVSAEALASARFWLNLRCIDDEGTVYVNGKERGRGTNFKKPLVLNPTTLLKAGRNVIAVVVHNRSGIGGLTDEVTLVGTSIETPVPLAGFELSRIAGQVEKWWEPQTDTADWRAVALDTTTPPEKFTSPSDTGSAESKALATWYRVEFELPERSPDAWVPWQAWIKASGDGFLYLNGHALGRYWDVGPQRAFYLPECWLNFGAGKKNVLVMCLQPIGGSTSLSAVEIAPYADLAETRPEPRQADLQKQQADLQN
jgi:hypothetical protein